jgi:hypothetical protein
VVPLGLGKVSCDSKLLTSPMIAFGLIIGFAICPTGTARTQAGRAEAGSVEEAIRSLTSANAFTETRHPQAGQGMCTSIAGHVREMAAGRH